MYSAGSMRPQQSSLMPVQFDFISWTLAHIGAILITQHDISVRIYDWQGINKNRPNKEGVSLVCAVDDWPISDQ